MGASDEVRRITARLNASERLINDYAQTGHPDEAQRLRDEIKTLRADLALAQSMLEDQ